MNLLNNWLFQSIISNLIWVIILAIVKWIRSMSKKEKAEIINDKIYSKKLVKNQFNICFYLSSFLTIILFVLIANNLQIRFQFLFIFAIFGIFFCYILMLGAFEASLEYMPDDKFKKK